MTKDEVLAIIDSAIKLDESYVEIAATQGDDMPAHRAGIEQMRQVRADVAEMYTQLAKAEADAAHWKANHDSMVNKSKLLHDRLDLPVERTKAYAYVTALEAENAQLRGGAVAWTDEMMERILSARLNDKGPTTVRAWICGGSENTKRIVLRAALNAAIDLLRGKGTP